MSKQSNYESDSMHKPSTFHLLHKKWNVLRTGVLWAQRLKSVKNTKSTDMTYTQFNNRSYNCSFSNQNSIVEDSNINNNSNCNNSSSNINVTTYNYTPQRTLSSITKLNDKDYDYIDKLQKRNTVIKHCSSAKRLAKTFSSSINVNTITLKSNDFESSNDLSKSPLLFSSRFQSSIYESNKDFKEVRFICEDSSKRNSVNTDEINNNTDTTNNKQVVNIITHKTNCNENNSTINRKDSVHNDSSENMMKISITNGFWPGNPYSPLPSPDISILDSDLNDNHFILDTELTNDDKNLQRHESWQSLELDTVPSSSGTGEVESLSTKTVITTTPTTTTKNITNENNTEFIINNQDGQDNEQIDLASRRGRRSAIIDKKNLIGETEVENQDTTTISQNVNKNLNETGQERPPITSSVNSFRERQKRILRKQNTISDLSCRNQITNTNQDYELKRRANVFMKLIERGTRSKDLNEALQSLKPSYFHDQYLESFRDSHWSQLDKSGNSENTMTDREVRRCEAVWELFKSELTFFTDHLMVLKNCFMEPLKKLQVDGYLMFVEPMHLFGNLDDLCYVSHTFCRELISNLSQESVSNEFGSTDVLLRPLKRWSEHSKDGEIYHNYCLNYDSALNYLDSLRKLEHFNEFEKWCEQDTRCRRLQLTDLLVAPMQHYMKIPLLLSSIRRYTACSAEQEMLTACLTKVENSLKSLEDKMRWLKNFERLQEIQSQLIWPSVSELEPRVFIPEFLRQSLIRQPCERLIANPKRQLLHEGFLTLNDGTKTIEIFAFLFDDFLLVTRIKKPPKKKSFSENPLTGRSLTEGGVFVVYRQVIALDRFTIHDLGIVEATANGLRNAIVLVLITRFQQITGVYTLQAANELDKQRWIEKLRNSQQAFQEKLKRKLYGIDMDQHTNKHSKLINAKNKLPNQTSIADDYINTSLTLSIKDTNDKSTNFYETNMIDKKNIVEQSLKKLTKSKTIQLEQQDQEQGDNHSQEDDHSNEIINTMVTSQITNIEANDATVNNNTVIVNTPDSNVNIKNSEPCNTLSGNIDYSSDESISNNNNNKIRSNDILSLHNKNPDYIIRNRHSLDPNFATLNISNNKYSDSIDITNSSSVTMNSSNTNIQMTSITEKQIVAPIFSPPSLLLFDRVTQHNEFPYEMTRQVQFSPPLSPILHPPCASLPLDITAESAYDLSDRLLSNMNISDDSSKLNNLINKRPIKGYSASPPVNRKNDESN
ncbi:Prolactin receptor, variant 2 [Schistosoma haematobium]|uniref:Prolactin receptor, variant 2 n=3 Tax=Schistosoma haematobium TaxID=6185 RepID=A0A922IW52_SCHHA|nr:Prolactin receptor, variant 2 [Schistosoma haematobium]KAH9587177.1 Prolactin receptor, variant 2 [Schistosoma haematobium]CAH8541162.1 unnamed protein product [Schistosoma haematobium]